MRWSSECCYWGCLPRSHHQVKKIRSFSRYNHDSQRWWLHVCIHLRSSMWLGLNVHSQCSRLAVPATGVSGASSLGSEDTEAMSSSYWSVGGAAPSSKGAQRSLRQRRPQPRQIWGTGRHPGGLFLPFSHLQYTKNTQCSCSVELCAQISVLLPNCAAWTSPLRPANSLTYDFLISWMSTI